MNEFKFNIGQTVKVYESLYATLTAQIVKQSYVSGFGYEDKPIYYYRIQINGKLHPHLWSEKLIEAM